MREKYFPFCLEENYEDSGERNGCAAYKKSGRAMSPKSRYTKTGHHSGSEILCRDRTAD
jgi:hypothetical protein